MVIAAVLLLQLVPAGPWIPRTGSSTAAQPISIVPTRNRSISAENAASRPAELNFGKEAAFDDAAARFGAASTFLTNPAPLAFLPTTGAITASGLPPFAIRPPIAPMPPQHDHKRLWLALAITQHGAAGFDAWATRRLISSGGGRELNPLLRPFADNISLYAAIQAGPLLFDFLERRMMDSHNRLARKTWWIPAAAGTAVSVFCAVHNLRIYSPAAPNPSL